MSTNAYIYFYMYNGTGQFQMFFPGVDVPNAAPGDKQFVMPPGDNWVVLDEVTGVYERLHVVASTYPIKELEALAAVHDVSQHTHRWQQELLRRMRAQQ